MSKSEELIVDLENYKGAAILNLVAFHAAVRNYEICTSCSLHTCIHFHFKMASQATTAKFSDLYELKEELGK